MKTFGEHILAALTTQPLAVFFLPSCLKVQVRSPEPFGMFSVQQIEPLVQGCYGDILNVRPRWNLSEQRGIVGIMETSG